MSTTSAEMHPEQKAFNTAERKSRAEKKVRRSKALVFAIATMTVIYFFETLGLDSVIYFIVGGIDSFGGEPWLQSVKGSLNTIKWMGFVAAAGFAYYQCKQES